MFEFITPEIQAQIMRSLDSVRTLNSLLHASPRFFQVFRTRREYFLTQVAFNQFNPGLHDHVWTLIKALELPRPAPLDDVHEFVSNLSPFHDHVHRESMLPTTIVPFCKIGTTIAWFVEDYRKSSLQLLADLGSHMDLQQDPEILQSDLSGVEEGRLQRAFCHFEIFSRLFFVPKAEQAGLDYRLLAENYLRNQIPDDVEELACVRDYLVRRLRGVFEAMEDRAVKDGPNSTIMKLGKAHPDDWFSGKSKVWHAEYVENIMSHGLGLLREILESDGLRRAELVIGHSAIRDFFITYAVSDESKKDSHHINLDFDAGAYDGKGDYIGEGLDNLSQGGIWANDHNIPSDWGRWPLKGLRDWGYVFWSGRRLQASGVLDQNPRAVANYLFDEKKERHSVEDRLAPCPWSKSSIECEIWAQHPPTQFAKRSEAIEEEVSD
ncbi:MAG: hypothetical protein Q9204_004802 [Flavoplaca sp. TL-2023a]